MMSFKTTYLSYLISFSLLGASVYFQSSALAFATVAALAVAVAQEYIEKKSSTKDIEFKLPDEFKRKQQDLEARVTTIEYGIKQRGF